VNEKKMKRKGLTVDIQQSNKNWRLFSVITCSAMLGFGKGKKVMK